MEIILPASGVIVVEDYVMSVETEEVLELILIFRLKMEFENLP